MLKAKSQSQSSLMRKKAKKKKDTYDSPEKKTVDKETKTQLEKLNP